jgi:hypothetical protein
MLGYLLGIVEISSQDSTTEGQHTSIPAGNAASMGRLNSKTLRNARRGSLKKGPILSLSQQMGKL